MTISIGTYFRARRERMIAITVKSRVSAFAVVGFNVFGLVGSS